VNELLGQPEYVHVLANPLLTHALPLAALGLLLALLGRSPGGIRLALVLVLLSAAAVWPVVHYGHAGFDRVSAMADGTGGDWLAVHRYRAEKLAWGFYVAAAAALAALLIPLQRAKSLLPLAWLALVLAGAASAGAAYIAYPAGKVRHREFRHADPLAAELSAAHAAAGDK
jgi:drug/metabolite transporter (DMT)-like permease